MNNNNWNCTYKLKNFKVGYLMQPKNVVLQSSFATIATSTYITNNHNHKPACNLIHTFLFL